MKTAIITGGSGAIGSALVTEFAVDHNVIFTYNSSKSAALKLAADTGSTAVQLDLADGSFSELEPYFRDCSLLINNAGISQIKMFRDTTDEDIGKMIATDLTGAMRLTRDVSRFMVQRRNGCIINISSVWGVYGASCEVAYSAAKAGLIGFTKALAKELGPSEIRVNCIAPGVIDSPMNSTLTERDLRELVDSPPLMRIGNPRHVAHAARFFEQNDFTTGQILGVDGGFC